MLSRVEVRSSATMSTSVCVEALMKKMPAKKASSRKRLTNRKSIDWPKGTATLRGCGSNDSSARTPPRSTQAKSGARNP